MEYSEIKKEQIASMSQEELVEYTTWLFEQKEKVFKWWVDSDCELRKMNETMKSFKTLISNNVLVLNKEL